TPGQRYPAIINGRIDQPHAEDRYRLLVKPGMRLRFDVLANRLGSPLDGVLSLRTEAGAELATNDDRADTVDPGFDFTVPDKVTALVIALKDLLGRAGPEFVYRLQVLPMDDPAFQMTISEDRVVLPKGGGAIVRVHADRAGYSGPIKIVVDGLPAHTVVKGREIPPGASDALLELRAPINLRRAEVLTHVMGSATINGKT